MFGYAETFLRTWSSRKTPCWERRDASSAASRWELQSERLFVAVIAIAEVALQWAVEYGRERVRFGKPIVKSQALAHRVADLATELEAAKSLACLTAWKCGRGKYSMMDISMAKPNEHPGRLTGDGRGHAGHGRPRVHDGAPGAEGMDGHAHRAHRRGKGRVHAGERTSSCGGTDEIMRGIADTTMGLYAQAGRGVRQGGGGSGKRDTVFGGRRPRWKRGGEGNALFRGLRSGGEGGRAVQDHHRGGNRRLRGLFLRLVPLAHRRRER